MKRAEETTAEWVAKQKQFSGLEHLCRALCAEFDDGDSSEWHIFKRHVTAVLNAMRDRPIAVDILSGLDQSDLPSDREWRALIDAWGH